MLSLELAQFTGGPIVPTVLIQPTARQSIEAAATTRDRVIALVLDNVRNRVVLLTPGRQGLDVEAGSAAGQCVDRPGIHHPAE